MNTKQKVKVGDFIGFKYDKFLLSVVTDVQGEWIKHKSIITGNNYEAYIDDIIKKRDQKFFQKEFGC